MTEAAGDGLVDSKRFDAMVTRLRQMADEGTKKVTGVLMVAKLPPRPDGLFSQAYLHEIYAPLSEPEIEALEQDAGRVIPSDLSAFYRLANGLSLFAGSLSINGARTDYSRSPDVRQPVSLRYGNQIERPAGAPLDAVQFGFYSADPGHHAWIDGSGEVYVTALGRPAPKLRTWPSLWTFLGDEVERLSSAYRTCRRRVDALDPLPAPI